MPKMIRSFTCLLHMNSQFREVTEKDINRIATRDAHPDNEEIFGFQVKREGDKLTVIAVLMAPEGRTAVLATNPNRLLACAGKYVGAGNDVNKLNHPHAEAQKFIEFIRGQYALENA